MEFYRTAETHEECSRYKTRSSASNLRNIKSIESHRGNIDSFVSSSSKTENIRIRRIQTVQFPFATAIPSCSHAINRVMKRKTVRCD